MKRKVFGKRKDRAAGLMALALTGALVFGGGGVVSAASLPDPVPAQAETTIPVGKREGSITICKKTEDGKALAGATFKIARVMDMADTDSDGFLEYKPNAVFAGTLNGLAADALGNYSAAQAEALAMALAETGKTLTTGETGTTVKEGTTADNGEAKFEGLPLGWYLVMETGVPQGYAAGKPFLLAVPSTDNYNQGEAAGTDWVYEVAAEPKNQSVSIEKTLGSGMDGSYGEGDFVQYQINTAIPLYEENYFTGDGNVVFTITDVMSDGLEIQNTEANPVTVTVGGEEVSSDINTFALTAAPASGENADLKVAFAKNFIKEHRGQAVVVTYYGKLTSAAVMGTEGNSNQAHLEYSNNPGTSSTGNADSGEVQVYSFGIRVVKFEKDGGKKKLPGAKFKLYADAELTEQVGEELSSNRDGELVFQRLDEGTYYLKETEAPAGYTLLTSPVKVEITAAETDNKATGRFTLKVNEEAVTAEKGEFTTMINTASGLATVAVENHKGFTLPSTGGVGIAVFLIIGAAGILAVSVVMLKGSRKKESK